MRVRPFSSASTWKDSMPATHCRHFFDQVCCATSTATMRGSDPELHCLPDETSVIASVSTISLPRRNSFASGDRADAPSPSWMPFIQLLSQALDHAVPSRLTIDWLAGLPH